jgi:hypothetical protein
MLNCLKNSYAKISAAWLLTLLLLSAAVSAAQNDQAAASRFSTDDFAHWLNAAYIAEATYQSRQDIEQALISQGYELKHFRQLEGFSVGYMIASNDTTRQQVIAVRGTSNVENVIVDAAFVLVPDEITGIDIHQGFLLSARDIYQQIRSEIKPGYTVNTIGS